MIPTNTHSVTPKRVTPWGIRDQHLTQHSSASSPLLLHKHNANVPMVAMPYHKHKNAEVNIQSTTPSPHQHKDHRKLAKASKVIDDTHLHPAFPFHAFPPQVLPPGVFPTHMPFYEAQIQAAYKDLMRPEMLRHPHPYVIPPNQLYPHLYMQGPSKMAHKK